MFKSFFIFCSGSDSKVLKDCSIGEQNKFAGIGATVFFTALMATIASAYGLYTVFDNFFIALCFGILWGFLIFNLDRYIVSTIKKRNSKLKEIFQVIPRLLLAVIIAVVISKPLELKIFEKEINQVLLEQKNELSLANKEQIALQFQSQKDEIKSNINNFQLEIQNRKTEVDKLYDTYISEAEGTAGTKLLGKGPVYKEKREKHDAALAELEQLKVDNKTRIIKLEDDLKTLNQQEASLIEDTQPIIDNFDGLMARVNALGELPWLPSFFIFLLFLAIETSPIFAKLLASKGEYDYKVEDYETKISTWIMQQVKERELLLNTDQEVNDQVYTDIANEEEVIKYKRQKAEELMRLQADTFYNYQKNAL